MKGASAASAQAAAELPDREPERFLYHEEGGTVLVEIAEDNSDAEWVRYVLRVVRQVSPSNFGDFSAPGTTFSVAATRQPESRAYINWRMEPAP